MNYKYIFANRLINRAEGGLSFLEECLRYKHGGTDVAWSRSWLILFSYNFELILYALFIIDGDRENKKDIIKNILNIKKKHDYDKLSKKISKKTLLKVGVKSVTKNINNGFIEHIIEMTNKQKIIVQDLIDIRYDFKIDNYRQVDPNEINKIKMGIKIFRHLVDSIQKLINKNGSNFI